MAFNEAFKKPLSVGLPLLAAAVMAGFGSDFAFFHGHGTAALTDIFRDIGADVEGRSAVLGHRVDLAKISEVVVPKWAGYTMIGASAVTAYKAGK